MKLYFVLCSGNSRRLPARLTFGGLWYVDGPAGFRRMPDMNACLITPGLIECIFHQSYVAYKSNYLEL
jgi:hypothetical protein